MKRGPSTKTSAPKRQAIDADTLLAESLKNTDIAGVKLALKTGANANGEMKSKNNRGRPLPYLHYAVSISDVAFTQALIDAGADPNIRSSNETTAPHEAIASSNHDALALLLSSGATVDLYDVTLGTPLMYAVKFDNLKIAQLLLQHGADMHHLGYSYASPLLCAITLEKNEMIALFESHGATLQNCYIKSNTPYARVFNLKLECFIKQREHYPTICRFFKALADKDIEQIESLLIHPKVQELIISPDNLLLQLLMQNKHFSLTRHLLANPHVSDRFTIEATMALVNAEKFRSHLLEIPAVKAQVLNNNELASQLLKTAISQNRYSEAALYLMDYNANPNVIDELEDEILTIVHIVNRLIHQTESALSNDLIDRIEKLIQISHSLINDYRSFHNELSNYIQTNAAEFNLQTLNVLRNLADNTYDESYIQELKDRLEFGVEDRPLEILGGNTLKDYVQQLSSKTPFTKQFEKAGIKIPRHSQLICPITGDVMSVPVSFSELQEVKRSNQTSQEMKTFYYDYEVFKKWYKTSHTNPMTRTKFDWSEVQPAPHLVEQMNMMLQDNKLKPKHKKLRS
ncbi:MAG: ankyrin repeat domain-containing protein [Candidatus Berkiella sp.]